MREAKNKFRSSIRFGGVAAIALIAASCATVDQELLDAQLPDIPTQWAADGSVSGVPTGDWVASFNDDMLRGLIEEAIARNNDLSGGGCQS